MKKLFKVVMVMAVVVAILGMAKVTASANEKAVSEAKDTRIIVDDNRNTEEDTKGDTFTYRLIVDKIDYLTFRKGHDGDYTLVYSVNGGQKHTVLMGMMGLELFNTMPTYISHYYDIVNVKTGDVIDYTYSYYNTYFQDTEPSVVEGSKVVDKPYLPEN